MEILHPFSTVFHPSEVFRPSVAAVSALGPAVAASELGGKGRAFPAVRISSQIFATVEGVEILPTEIHFRFMNVCFLAHVVACMWHWLATLPLDPQARFWI